MTFDGVYVGHLAWSPDGRQILFHTDRDGNVKVYVMDADGSKIIRIEDLRGASSPDALAAGAPGPLEAIRPW